MNSKGYKAGIGEKAKDMPVEDLFRELSTSKKRPL